MPEIVDLVAEAIWYVQFIAEHGRVPTDAEVASYRAGGSQGVMN